MTSIDDPDLQWRDGAPVSARFGDSYFSREGGLEESRAVFLAGCGLPDAWRGRGLFRVGELGFGTGLNVLALWDLWRRTRAPGQRLIVVSAEGFPLSAEEAARAHAAFPEIAELAARMRAQWPARSPGAHFLDFPDDGFALTVVHGEAGAALAEMEGAFDAWFLDGFAPARNPDMWRPELFARIAQLSAPGARAATFTVASAARRALSEAGFAVEKRPGFGRKKERLEAVFAGPASAAAPDPFARGAAADGDALILGGGIAGCALAHALASRGRRATIVSEGAPASLPPAALLTPRLEAAGRPHARALFNAFRFAADLYERLDAFTGRGALRLGDADEAARFAILAALWPELELQDGALFAPKGGVLAPARVLDALTGDTVRIEARVASVRRDGGDWRLFDAAGAEIARAPVLVLAGGASGAGEALLAPLRLGFSGGQVSLHRARRPPRTAVTWGGFAAPVDGQVMVGATHDHQHGAAPPAPDAARVRALAEAANVRLPEAGVDPEPQTVWTGVRAVTADRLPCAGPVPDADVYRAMWAEAAKGGRSPERGAAPFLAGLFTLTGLGSRGFAHAPLLAESVAAEICGEPSPLEAAGRRALHPARFLWRALKRA